MDDSYSDCLNKHHIRESVDLNDEKVGGGCYDSTGDNIAFVAKSRGSYESSCSDIDYLGSGSGTSRHLANLLVRRSIDPKDENDENIYYDSIGNNVVSVDCDITSLTRVSGSHDTFGENINSIGTSDRLTNRHIIRSANHNVENSYICYNSIGSDGAFIDNGGGSYGFFNDSVASLDNCNNTSDRLINH